MVAIALLIAIVYATPGFADNKLDHTERALSIISKFADEFCKSPPTGGTAHSVELSGRSKAELDRVLRRLVKLGYENAGKYNYTNYQGLLQTDVLAAIRDNTKCREHVLDALSSKLLAANATNAGNKSSKRATSAPPSQTTNNYTDQSNTGNQVSIGGNVGGNVIINQENPEIQKVLKKLNKPLKLSDIKGQWRCDAIHLQDGELNYKQLSNMRLSIDENGRIQGTVITVIRTGSRTRQRTSDSIKTINVAGTIANPQPCDMFGKCEFDMELLFDGVKVTRQKVHIFAANEGFISAGGGISVKMGDYEGTAWSIRRQNMPD